MALHTRHGESTATTQANRSPTSGCRRHLDPVLELRSGDSAVPSHQSTVGMARGFPQRHGESLDWIQTAGCSEWVERQDCAAVADCNPCRGVVPGASMPVSRVQCRCHSLCLTLLLPVAPCAYLAAACRCDVGGEQYRDCVSRRGRTAVSLRVAKPRRGLAAAMARRHGRCKRRLLPFRLVSAQRLQSSRVGGQQHMFLRFVVLQ